MGAHVLRGAFHDGNAVNLAAAGRVARNVMTRLRHATCGLIGHDYFIKAAGHRIFLRCADCGHETPGWSIDVRMPRGPSAQARAVRSQPPSETSRRARAA